MEIVRVQSRALLKAPSSWYDGGMRSKFSLLALTALIAFSGGLLLGSQGVTQATWVLSGPERAPEQLDLAPVYKAWRLLEEKYVPATTTDPLSAEDRVWGIIKGLAASYDDPYTTFLPPQQATSFEQDISGEFGGVGFEIGMRQGILTVIAPLKGTPADRAGILAGDLIVEIDGKGTQNMSIDEAITHLRGEVGTEVVLTLAREGEREFLEVPIIRDTIVVPTLDAEVIDGVYVISLYNFGGTAMREMRGALRTFVASGNNKLIIDLRGNPGGYLDAAVDMASWFLPLGKAVVIEDYGPGKTARTHRSKGYDITKTDWRIAVLIDGGSASASEILAGALGEHKKAVLIGEKTFGKGSVQELVDVTPDTFLKITVARWLTPLGHSISEAGLIPDLVVPMTSEDMEQDRDPQLAAALTYVRNGVLPEPETTPESNDAAEVDTPR